jgi:CBS domain-containing protein
MHSLVRDVMTSEVATVAPTTSSKEIVARLLRHRVSALPVVDGEGRVLGVVSEADLLKVFLRSDGEIAADVRQEVLVRSLWVAPDSVDVDVRDGVVTLRGRLERRSQIAIAVSLVHALDGVVDVVESWTSRSTTRPSWSPPTC